MEEYAAWLLGALLGICYPHPRSSRIWRGLFYVLVVGLGTTIAVVSGEWAKHPGFAVIDIGQIALAAALGLFVRRRILARSMTPRTVYRSN